MQVSLMLMDMKYLLESPLNFMNPISAPWKGNTGLQKGVKIASVALTFFTNRIIARQLGGSFITSLGTLAIGSLIRALANRFFYTLSDDEIKARKEKTLTGDQVKDMYASGIRDFRHHNLSNTDLTEANLDTADLTGADLTGAILTGANLEEADLTGATLSSADFTDANLEWTWLRCADFTDANLTETDLSGAIVTDADFTGVINVNLTKALGKPKVEPPPSQ